METLVTLLVYAFLFYLLYLVVGLIMDNLGTPPKTQGVVKAVVLFFALLFLISWLGGYDWPTIPLRRK